MITKFKIFEGKKIIIDEYSFTLQDIQKYYKELGKYNQPKTKNFIIKYLTDNTISIQSKNENGMYYDKVTPVQIYYDPQYIDQFTLYFSNNTQRKWTSEYKLRDDDVITLYNISGYLRNIIEKIELKKASKKYNI